MVGGSVLCAIDRSILCRLWLGSQASVRRLECESTWVALLALLYREESAVDDAWLFIRLLQESGDGSAARAVLLKALAGACRAGPGRAGPGPHRRREPTAGRNPGSSRAGGKKPAPAATAECQTDSDCVLVVDGWKKKICRE